MKLGESLNSSYLYSANRGMVAAAPQKSQIADEELTADRISKIEPKKIRNISNDQLQQISTEAIKNLTKPQISQLSTDQIVALIGDQIAAFTTKQISSFSSRQIKSIETSDIQQLTANQLNSLTKEEIMALTEDQMSALNIDQLNAFTETNIKYLSSKQINSIQEESFINLNSSWFQELTKTQMAGLEVNKINQLELESINSIGFDELAFYFEKNAKKISAEFISKMEANNGSAIVFNSNTIKKMDAAVIGSINPDVIARILPSAFTESQNFLDSLNQEQVSKITKLQVSAINAKLISNLSSNFINSLNKNSFEALSVTQLGFLSADQLINLNSDQLSTLHGAKLRSIDAKSLTVDQLASLSTDQIADLSAVQISALTTDQIKGMSVEQVQSIEVKDFSVLKSEQLNSMTLGQMNALDSKQIQEISSRKINSISTDIFSQLDSEIVSSLSRNQISKIDQSHLSTMQANQLSSFSGGQITALSQNQIKNLTSTQLSQVSSTLIEGLSVAQLRAFTENQIGSLGADQVEGITAEKLSKLKNNQLSSFSEDSKRKLDEIGATAKLSNEQKAISNITDFRSKNISPTGGVAIAGKMISGEKLTVTNNIVDGNGISSAGIIYQWYIEDEILEGFNSDQLLLTDAYLGKHISVKAIYKDLAGYDEVVSSASSDDLVLKGNNSNLIKNLPNDYYNELRKISLSNINYIHSAISILKDESYVLALGTGGIAGNTESLIVGKDGINIAENFYNRSVSDMVVDDNGNIVIANYSGYPNIYVYDKSGGMVKSVSMATSNPSLYIGQKLSALPSGGIVLANLISGGYEKSGINLSVFNKNYEQISAATVVAASADRVSEPKLSVSNDGKLAMLYHTDSGHLKLLMGDLTDLNNLNTIDVGIGTEFFDLNWSGANLLVTYNDPQSQVEYGKIYNSSGGVLKDLFKINESDVVSGGRSGSITDPSIAALQQGGWAVVWQDISEDSKTNIHIRSLASDGSMTSNDYLINIDNANQVQPLLASDERSNLILYWVNQSDAILQGVNINASKLVSDLINQSNNNMSTVNLSSPAEPSVYEGNAGVTQLTYKVTLDKASATEQSIDWSVYGTSSNPITASDFADGSPTSGKVVFQPGETSKDIVLNFKGDTVIEPDEDIQISIGNPSSGLKVGDWAKWGQIKNDDADHVLTTQGTGTLTGTPIGTQNYTYIPIDLSSFTAGGDLSISINLGNGSSGASYDLFEKNPADLTSAGRPIGSLANAYDVSPGTTTVLNYKFSTSQAKVLYLAIDGNWFSPTTATNTYSYTIDAVGSTVLPTVNLSSPAEPSVYEGNAGVTQLTYKVTLDKASATEQSIDWSVYGTSSNPITASDFADGSPTSGKVVFQPGETSKDIVLNFKGDTVIEPDEDIQISIGNPSSGLKVGDWAKWGQIKNDDAVGMFNYF